MDAIRRWLEPPVASAVIALIVAAQVVAVLSFSVSYAARAQRIADLEAALCRARLAQFPGLASDIPCPDAQHVMAQALPQVWTDIPPTASADYSRARVVGPRWSAGSQPSMARVEGGDPLH